MIIDLEDEIGNIDRCEVEPTPSTRVIRVIERIKTVYSNTVEDRNYSIGCSYACGYKD